MQTAPILLAEADPRALVKLHRLLSERIPGVELHLSKSVDEATHKLQSYKYDTVITSTSFLLERNHMLLHSKRALQSLVPLVVTVAKSDRIQAHEILQQGSFSILAKPIEAREAIKTVKLALWQNRLLRLIASREKALATFREHIQAFPEDWKSEQLFSRTVSVMEKAFVALGTSMQRIEETHDKFLYDIAASVEARARQRALDHLFQSSSEGRSQ